MQNVDEGLEKLGLMSPLGRDTKQSSYSVEQYIRNRIIILNISIDI